MNRVGAVIVGLVWMGFFGGGWSAAGDPPAAAGYRSPTAPESLVFNLQESYRQREIEEYAKLLAPEFVYKFQRLDFAQVPKGFWTHDEDSVGTRALFLTDLVEEIRIDLIGLAPEPSNDVDHPAGAVKIRIVTTNLEVDQADRITWLATDQQDMFFRKGSAAAGEDSTEWLLFEWRDLESHAQAGMSGPTPTVPMTWGGIKARYDPPSSGHPATWGFLKTLYQETSAIASSWARAGGLR